MEVKSLSLFRLLLAEIRSSLAMLMESYDLISRQEGGNHYCWPVTAKYNEDAPVKVR
jgi:hypothetical protein